jgi:hypothetical protein
MDFDNKEVKVAIRHDGSKRQVKWSDLSHAIPEILE